MITPSLLKALQIFSKNHRYGGGLLGNERGCSERKKLDLATAGYLEQGRVNPSIYHVSAKGQEALRWAMTPIYPVK
jgi:hypothetical protein